MISQRFLQICMKNRYLNNKIYKESSEYNHDTKKINNIILSSIFLAGCGKITHVTSSHPLNLKNLDGQVLYLVIHFSD